MSGSLFGELPPAVASDSEEPSVKKARRDPEDHPNATYLDKSVNLVRESAEKTSDKNPEEATNAHGRAPPQPSGVVPSDAIAMALVRISNHISQPSKFIKASDLLRQLLEGDTLNAESHGDLVFDIFWKSVRDPTMGLEPAEALALTRLFTTASKRQELYTPRQRDALDVLGIRGALRSGMVTTDDSFAFNKIVSRLKAAVEALGPYEQSSEADAVDGIDKVDGADQVFDPDRLTALRRSMLLDCMEAGKVVYRRPWAQTSIDLFVDHCRQHVNSFSVAERHRIGEMIAFVKEKRAHRKQGPTAKEVNRDTTSFERARSAWSTASVSHRGKVGGGGDHKSENWLG